MGKEQLLNKAFDAVSLDSKLVHLREEQANTFVDYMKDESAFLKAIRFVKMNAPTKTIAKLYANGQFLHPGQSGVSLADSKNQKFSTETIELVSKMVRGTIFITDEELEDNIEGSNFKEHMMRMVAKKVANELEEASIYSSKIANPTTLLEMFDGFKGILTANGGSVVDATDTNKFTDALVAKDKFTTGLKGIATKYRQGLKYFCPSDVLIDYGLLYDTVADSAVRQELRQQVVGKPLVEVPLMHVDPSADVIFGDPLNFIYAVQTGQGAIQFEQERVPSLGYKYHFKMRLDIAVENPEAAGIITGLAIK